MTSGQILSIFKKKNAFGQDSGEIFVRIRKFYRYFFRFHCSLLSLMYFIIAYCNCIHSQIAHNQQLFLANFTSFCCFLPIFPVILLFYLKEFFTHYVLLYDVSSCMVSKWLENLDLQFCVTRYSVVYNKLLSFALRRAIKRCIEES